MTTVSSSPHVHDSLTTPKAMFYVLCALLPAALWGVVVFGLRALLVLLVSVGASLLTEYLLGRVSKENTLSDFSAAVTGLLVGMNMPPQVPLYVPVIASAFAIAVVKWTFGGLGCNWANPAIAGRIFVFFSFTSGMSTFSLPRTLAADSVTGATILSTVKTAIAGGTAAGLTYDEVLAQSGMLTSGIADRISSAIPFLSPYEIDAFIGNVGGCIGEVSALLLLAGGIFLICKKIITWHIPAVYLGSFAILSWIFGGCPRGLGLFHGEILLPLLSGGLFLGAFFMATDWVTTPTTARGQVIFAVGCGFFTFLIRYFGSLPEGVSLAILLMNILSPTIERYVKPRKFGYVKPEKKTEVKA